MEFLKKEKENHMIFSVDAENALDITQNLFIIKILSKQCMRANFLDMIEGIYETPISARGQLLKQSHL